MQEIKLNLIPNGISEIVYLNQYDIGQPFKITFQDGIKGASFNSTPDVKINGRKGDNHVFVYTEDDKYDDSHYIITKEMSDHILTVTIRTSEQMTAAYGDTLAQLVLTVGGAIAGTLNFIMRIQEQPAAEGDPSGSDLPSIIAAATVQMQRAEAAAESAATDAASASADATSAGNSKTAAESARDRAETAADKAEEWSAHPPQVNANGNWDVWNIPDQQYEDSGIDCGPTIGLDPDGAITMLDPDGTARIDNISQSDTDPVFHFYIPRGKGISSIVKTGTSGLTDTYTITYSDGATYTYNVVNGKSAYQSAVEGGYQGTEADFYADLGLFVTYKTAAQTAATNAGNSETAAAGSAQAASGSANAAAGSAGDAEAYAVGKRGGTDVPSTDPAYHNNSKYYSDQASTSASNASSSAGLAAQSATAAHDDMLTTDGYKTAAQTYASNASNSAVAAAGYKDSAEGYAGNAQQSAGAAQVSETNASGSSTTAARRAQDAEAWAVGQRGGEDVPSTDETYHNNSKYYSEQAAASAAATADVSTGSTGKTVKVAINPTAAQISAYDNGAIWIET